MTPRTAAVPDVGNGIQNKTPLLGQQVQPKFHSPLRIHGNRVQHGFKEIIVHVPADQIASVHLHIDFQSCRFIGQPLPFPGGRRLA